MKIIQHLAKRISFCILSLLLLLPTLKGCKKDGNESLNSGPASVKVKLTSIEVDSENLNLNASTSSSSANNIINNPIEIPLNKELSAYLTLEETTNTSKEQIHSSKLNHRQLDKKATVTQIGTNIKYEILVYLQDQLIDRKVFTAGQEASATPFALDGGKTYTFVSYSSNSTSSLPTVIDAGLLSTAKIENESGDLLYSRQQLAVTTGVNNLSIILKHQYSLITTELKVGTTYQGVINAVSGAKFENTKASASIKLSNGVLTYPTANTTAHNITFPTISASGVANLTSTPANLLIAPTGNSTTSFAISSISVNGISHTIPVTTFQMKAGKKYKLVLTFDVPCLRTIQTFSTTNNGTTTVNNIHGANGVIINLDYLDDSFNLNINGTNLFEMNAQKGTRTGTQTTTGTFTRKITRVYYSTSPTPPASNDAVWSNTSSTLLSTTNYTPTGDLNWTGLNINNISYSTTNWIKADLSFLHNMANGEYTYANAHIGGVKTSDYTIYQVNENVIAPETPAIRVNISNNGTITIEGKKSTSSTTYYPISLGTTAATLTFKTNTTDSQYPASYFLEARNVSSETFTSNTNSPTSTYELSTITEGNQYKHTRVETQTLVGATKSRNITETIYTDVSFRANTPIWNSNGWNTIILGQRVVGGTSMRGNVVFRTKINCNTQTPVL